MSKVPDYQKENSDTFMGKPNPVVRCPACDAKQRWFEAKLNLIRWEPPEPMLMGCIWCDEPFDNFIKPGVLIEYTLHSRQFRMDITKYDPYWREVLIETLQDKEFLKDQRVRDYHEKVARALEKLDMMAVDKFGGLRNIHRKFLETLVRVCDDEDRYQLYQAEIERREESKNRPKKRKKSEDDSKPLQYNPKKPKAKERIPENKRGWDKGYYG